MFIMQIMIVSLAMSFIGAFEFNQIYRRSIQKFSLLGRAATEVNSGIIKFIFKLFLLYSKESDNHKIFFCELFIVVLILNFNLN